MKKETAHFLQSFNWLIADFLIRLERSGGNCLFRYQNEWLGGCSRARYYPGSHL